jgi:putative ABC transport system permease protein
VFNTISALLTRQVRQVGIMKAIGARTGQIMGMYLVAALSYGLLSLLVAIPLANLATRWITDYVAGLLNFDIVGFSIPPRVYALEASVGLAAPLLAALFPIIAGARVTVQQAISTYGLDVRWSGTTWVDRLLRQVRGLSRPLLLSLRNTFRRKGRLAFTLTPLILSCAIFIAVSSVHDSLLLTLEETLERWSDDIMVRFARSHRIDRLEQEALNVPGVVAVEVWGDVIACRVRPDGSQSANILIYAPPAGTTMFFPTILQGRWLALGDENAIVINAGLLSDEPDLDIGDEMVLKIRGRDSVWTVVGIAQGGGALEGSFAYINRPYWERSVGEIGQANRVHIVTEQHSMDFQAQVARLLEGRFDRAGIRIAGTYIETETRTRIVTAFNIVIVFLSLMAVLLAWVGGLGLMGMMSINVLERTRETGVMRAIGADNRSIWQIFIVEGVFIGVISWFLGCGIAVPLSKLFNEIVGMTLMNTSPAYEFSVGGALIWLGLAVVIAALASLVPAWNASRISVSETLTYE